MTTRNDESMREFNDEEGRSWTAGIAEREGLDYKGRFHLIFRPTAQEDPTVGLEDVRWNSEKTALRTLETMSGVELRRRLRSARGRAEGA
jgi:hypothetical protein